ncbi:dynactin-associated protein-like [Ictidomys tridecemlineatus]
MGSGHRHPIFRLYEFVCSRYRIYMGSGSGHLDRSNFRKKKFSIQKCHAKRPSTCPDDQQAHSSTSLCPPSNDVTADVSSSLSGVWVSPGITAHSQCPHPELSTIQVQGNSGSEWSLWKVFLACLLACAITTAIGVLVICLVNNRGSNSSVVIQLPTSNGGVVVKESGTASTTSQPTVTTTSTEPSAITTSRESTTTRVTTSSSTQPSATTPLTTTSSRTTTATETMGTVAPP